MAAMDLVLLMEPQRRFAAAEVAAGRLPMWAPYDFAGAPFIWPKFSPFLALEYCTKSPVVLAWGALAAALVAGLGAYGFFRRALAVGFWPAAICAWCYPLTAFFIFWQGYPTDLAVYWLPWLLLAVEGTVRGRRLAPAGLGVVTGLVLVSGHLDVAGQVLLGSGLYGLWRLVCIDTLGGPESPTNKGPLTPALSLGERENHPPRYDKSRRSGISSDGGRGTLSFGERAGVRGNGAHVVSTGSGCLRPWTGRGYALLMLAAGVGAGVHAGGAACSSFAGSTRARGRGWPPAAPVKRNGALSAWCRCPRWCCRCSTASSESGSFPAFPAGEPNLLETPAAAYAGLLATLFVAPLAFCERRHLQDELLLGLPRLVRAELVFECAGLRSSSCACRDST